MNYISARSPGYLAVGDDCDQSKSAGLADFTPVGIYKPAPASVTLMRKLQHDVVEPLALREVDEGEAAGKAVRAVQKIGANMDKALKAGVDATKKSFWSKVLGASVAALALGAVIAISVSTGGVPLIAAAVIAGVICAISVADAGAAWRSHQNAKARHGGKPEPYDLPMGSSSLGNLLYKAAEFAGVSAPGARRFAVITDNTLRFGMAVAASACTMGVTVGAESIGRIAPMVASAATMLQSVIDIKHNKSTNQDYGDGRSGLKEDFADLDKIVFAAELRDSIVDGKQDEIKDALRARVLIHREEASTHLDRVRAQLKGNVGTAATAGPLLVITAAYILMAATNIPMPTVLESAGNMPVKGHQGGTSSGSPQQNPAKAA